MGKVGNTRLSPSIHWCFTLNLPTEEELGSIGSRFTEPCVAGFVYQLEEGEEKTPHLQGYVKFTKKCRPLKWMGLKRMHWEAARSPKHSILYCQKEEGRLADPVVGGCIRRIRPLKVLHKDALHPWQKELDAIVAAEPDDRSILWIWEKQGGVGKSAMTKYLCHARGAIVSGGKTADVFNQVLEEVKAARDPWCVILDVPRNSLGFINYSALEKVKDGCFYSGKYEGGMCLYNSPHVIVFANEEPDYENMSQDRWVVKEIGANKAFI